MTTKFTNLIVFQLCFRMSQLCEIIGRTTTRKVGKYHQRGIMYEALGGASRKV